MKNIFRLGVTCVVLFPLLSSGSAWALSFKKCGEDVASRASIECAEVTVPLDYANPAGEKIKLSVKRIKSSKKQPSAKRRAVLALAGGPGQSAGNFVPEFAEMLRKSLESNDLVVFDQRGTGRSNLLRCPELEKAGEGRAEYSAIAERCAVQLGSKRSFFTTKESAADIESIRRALGVGRLTLFGVSYGTKVALEYAATRPQNLDRLVLDSTVLPEGPDVLYRSTFAAIKRVLRLLCSNSRCEQFTDDPTVDLTTLVRSIGSRGPLRGKVVSAKGRLRSASLNRSGLLSLILHGDVDPTLRSQLPAAIFSAKSGDTVPLLRLADRAKEADAVDQDPNSFSAALFAATTCTELAFPWGDIVESAPRLLQAQAVVQSLPAESFLPFDRETALSTDEMRLCQRWPRERQVSLAQLPVLSVPALLVSGEDDLRTPLEDANKLLNKLPEARLMAVPGAGHSVLSSEISGCAQLTLDRFLLGRPLGKMCRDLKPIFDLQQPAPTRLSSVPEIVGQQGSVGRTLKAVELTLKDARMSELSAFLQQQSPFDPVAGGGLRSGYFKGLFNGLHLRHFSYVPGVTVNGTLIERGARLIGKVRIGGSAAAKGELVLAYNGKVSGKLAGRKVKAKFDTRLGRLSSGSAVSAMRSGL